MAWRSSRILRSKLEVKASYHVLTKSPSVVCYKLNGKKKGKNPNSKLATKL
jgi:hypothetical protein